MSEEEYEVEAIGVEVSSQPIELYKVLKIANAVGGGGEAKFVISEGYVAVNGELEQRKRRKMYDGDVIEFNSEYYVVLCDKPVDETPEVIEPKPAKKTEKKSKPANKKSAGKAKKKDQNSGPADQATGRKPISF
ncbi:RNA-binding S4 domain-containing protein [Photobacterium sp. SDRW27]|uniref:RNA-binding S4 domain-containing protein n=1 Tax=Photobacterium obscurum TaxID=2829490 RepID=UPI002244323B|nr:RNA-binding S4 domain-containing protein [Photobacterium obscurum]MCW8331148.1 RNA-binding S4 domain-containing protein [Photobacterium obscurum]